MATLEDIARVLGVSKSTVSKALSGAGDVSDAMRRSVVETAVELGYSRIRRGDEAPRLAVFITNMGYASQEDFGYEVLVGFRKLAEPAGYQVSVIPLERELEARVGYDQYMMQQNYLGALFLGLSPEDPWLQDFETCRTPAVLYDNRVSGNPRISYVGVDNAEGLRLAVGHLKTLGHRRVGYLSSPLNSYVYRQRHAAFFQALWEWGLPREESLARSGPRPEQCLPLHLNGLLEQGCTAVICSHDSLAAAVLVQCREMGISVPEDLSVLGFDDLPLCQAARPPLTTIRQDRAQLGKSAYCALASQLEGVRLSTFLLHPELIPRASCAPRSQ